MMAECADPFDINVSELTIVTVVTEEITIETVEDVKSPLLALDLQAPPNTQPADKAHESSEEQTAADSKVDEMQVESAALALALTGEPVAMDVAEDTHEQQQQPQAMDTEDNVSSFSSINIAIAEESQSQADVEMGEAQEVDKRVEGESTAATAEPVPEPTAARQDSGENGLRELSDSTVVSNAPSTQTAPDFLPQNLIIVPPTQDGSGGSNNHALANASLLALAPSLPVIRMSREIYLTLANLTAPTLNAPSCCPPQTTYNQFLLVGTRDVLNEKLIVEVKTLIPFSSSDLSILNAFVTHLNSNGQTVLGWAVSTRFDTTPLPQALSAQQPLLDMASASIASSYFDLFHSAALTVLSRNCEPLKLDSGLPNLSRFCVEACAFLQDCIGIVSVNRSVLAGSSIIIPFDTPELMPYDIERRLAVITPHLFAAIDISLSKHANTPPPNESSGSGSNFGNSLGKGDQDTVRLPSPTNSIPTVALLPPNLPSLIKVHQLPHSTLHVLGSVLDEFIPQVLKSDGIMEGVLEGTNNPTNHDNGSASAEDEQSLETKFIALQEQIRVGLENKVSLYEASFNELEDLMAVYDVLKGIKVEDLLAKQAEV